jgi:predicted RNA methylase
MKNIINSNSQMHGKAFENMLKAVFNASDTKRLSTSKFDIEAKFNKDTNSPISIKTMKAETKSICMSDARRFFEETDSFTMIVGLYFQKDKRKVFEEIREYYISVENLQKIKGEVTLEDVELFHEQLKKFEYGRHIEARYFAKSKLKELKNKHSLIILNPKIDSKFQRRLQCSLPIDKLEKVIGKENIKIHKESFGFLTLPIVIFSEERKVNMKESPEIKAAKALDQFYTAPEVANNCAKILKDYLSGNNIDVENIVEPSAGAGAFSMAANNVFRKEIISYDIDPKFEGVIKCDFLEQDISSFKGNKTIVIGNPPFGKNSSLAIKFFNKSAEFADVIGFVLPKTFKKTSVINKLDNYFHLEKEIEIPLNSFLVLGEVTDVPCVFQIWRKKSEKREKIISDAVCEDYSFETREIANWAFQRVGVKAGALKDKNKFTDIADASHIFLNFKNEDDSIVFSLIDWEKVKYNTAGNPSISKTEMKTEYLKAKSECLLLMKEIHFEETVKRMAIFKDDTGVHVRSVENGVMVRHSVRKILDDEEQTAYSLTYMHRGYPFTINKSK